MLTISYGSRPTPLGILFAARTERGACALFLLNHEHDQSGLNRTRKLFPKATLTESLEAVEPIITLAVAHVAEGQSCDDLALDLHGTPFQLRVWEALRAIPRGEITTYADLTRSLGLVPGTARAVGSACGTNPVSLIVPCHRVLSSGGGLGGYYWGLDRKKAFLEMEGAALPNAKPARKVLAAT
jgi:AraC family transcriptional regulator, regulatory protein of adaptative response / methylated-DNA-[protein]-cysteine methyltransferase